MSSGSNAAATCARKARHLAARLHDDDFSIITQYQAEYRGLVQYYLLAFNVHRLWRLHHVMRTSWSGPWRTSIRRGSSDLS